MATITITDVERTMAHAAYEMFNTYAAWGEADVSIFEPIQQLQIIHHRWQERALSAVADRSLSVMAHGVTEEGCWELIEAIEQGNEDEQADALGDLLIYVCAACTQLRLDFATLCRGFDVAVFDQLPDTPVEPLMSLVKAIGQFNHVVGKAAQKTRGYDEIAKVREHAGAVIVRICSLVHWMCYANNWNVFLVFDNTLHKVMKRDWTKNAITGDVSAQTQLDV